MLAPQVPSPASPPRTGCATRAWLGFALAAAGVAAYVLLLGERFLRVSGVAAFAPLAVGLGMSLLAWRRAPGWATRIAAFLTVGLAVAFSWVFFVVARLPAPSTFERLDVAPDFTLAAGADRSFHLADEVERGPLLLVFFRGHW